MNREFTKEYSKKFIEDFEELRIEDIENISNAIWQAYLEGNHILIMGNGGSASIASHFACDLGKAASDKDKPRFRVQSMNDNIPMLTAFANDYGYENVFIEQLKNLANENDVVIAISSSGNSENMVRAIDYANKINATTIAITGFGGGKISKTAKIKLILNSADFGIVETIHMFVCHILAFGFRERFEKRG